MSVAPPLGPDDVGRSVRRYVSDMLGDPWVIDLERTEVRDDARPAAVIETGALRVRSARASVPQGSVDVFMPVTVTLYPSLADPVQAGRTARTLAFSLEQLILLGADGPVQASGRPASGPDALPLYDYRDVPLPNVRDGVTPGPERAVGIMRAEDYSANAIEDPLDARRWTVVLELTLAWEQEGRVGSEADAPLAASMTGTVEWRG